MQSILCVSSLPQDIRPGCPVSPSDNDNKYYLYQYWCLLFCHKLCGAVRTIVECNVQWCMSVFLVRAFEDEKKAKMGVVECVKHELLDPFAVLWEREGKFSQQKRKLWSRCTTRHWYNSGHLNLCYNRNYWPPSSISREYNGVSVLC